MKETRITVGIPGQFISSIWKIWIQGNDIYAADRQLNRIGGDFKTSLHASGICRCAQNNQRDDGSDRAMLKWNEKDFPHPCARGAFLLKRLIVPTNMLSRHNENAHETSKVRWISPAPENKAVEIDIIRSPEKSDRDVAEYYHSSNLIFQSPLRGGKICSVVANYVDIDDIDFVMASEPRVPGQAFTYDIKFSSRSMNTDRPIRMTMSKGPPVFWNMGGYRMPSYSDSSHSLKNFRTQIQQRKIINFAINWPRRAQ